MPHTHCKKLGFNTFTELAYCRQTRNCYDAKDVSAFRSRIVRDIVPVVCRLKKMQKKRIGIDDMKYTTTRSPLKRATRSPTARPRISSPLERKCMSR